MNMYAVVMAFQHFAGKQLSTLDALEELDSADKNKLVEILKKVEKNLRNSDYDSHHILANQIAFELSRGSRG